VTCEACSGLWGVSPNAWELVASIERSWQQDGCIDWFEASPSVLLGVLALQWAARGSSLLAPITLTRRAQLSVKKMSQLPGRGPRLCPSSQPDGLRAPGQTTSRRFGLARVSCLNQQVSYPPLARWLPPCPPLGVRFEMPSHDLELVWLLRRATESVRSCVHLEWPRASYDACDL